jgi:hypothetical protein
LAFPVLLAILLGSEASATVRFTLTADRLNNASGSAAASSSSLVLVIADTADDGVSVSPGAAALYSMADGSGGDDLIIYRTDLSASGTSGVLFDTTPALDLALAANGVWNAGDDIYVVWFPGLTTNPGSPSAGDAYGVIKVGETPADGATESFSYITLTNSGNYGTGSQTDTAANQTIPTPNSAPTDISLTGTSIVENVSNPTVGTLSTTDVDAGDAHTYSLAAGTGDTDNGSFTISNGQLVFSGTADFETKNQYSVRIRTTDTGSQQFEKAFTINVTNVNEAPTLVTLGNTSFPENFASAVVGALSATDLDAGTVFTFSLVAGTGSTDNASFTIAGSNLQFSGTANFEAKSSYSVRVRASDNGSPALFVEQAFPITVTNVNEAPTSLALSANTVDEGNAIDFVVGTLTSADPDAGDTSTFSLVSGAGSTDNGSFNLSGNSLRLGVVTDFETKSSYQVRVRVADVGGLSFEQAFTITVNDLPESAVVINVAGSSAFRAVINQALIQFLGGASICKYAYVGTTGISGAETAIFEGVANGNLYIVRTALEGSIKGIADVIQGNSVEGFLDDAATASDRVVGGRAITAAGKTESATPRFVFSDSNQNITPTPTPALAGQAIAVLPYVFVANPGSPASLTNITDQAFTAQWSLGEMSLAVYTGNASHTTSVLTVGATPDSGMRAAVLSETRFGPFTFNAQYSSAELNGIEGTGTVSSLDGLGNTGFPSASALRSVLSRRSASTRVSGGSPSSVILVGYLSLPDAAAVSSVTGGAGDGSVALKYNGFGYSASNVANGAYTLWSYEYLYRASNLSGAESIFINAFEPSVPSVLTGQNAIRLDSMNVLRFGGDGGILLP